MLMKEARAELEFHLDSEEEAMCIYQSIKPELDATPSDRATVALNPRGEKLLLSIEAREAAPFRAAVLTYLRWIRTAKEIGRI